MYKATAGKIVWQIDVFFVIGAGHLSYTSRNSKLVLITGRKTAGSSQQENVAPEILRGCFHQMIPQ